jgi:hypothetical protein
MVMEIQTDTNEFANIGNASAKARRPCHAGKACRIKRPKPAKGSIINRIGVNISNVIR